ncbi:hypothetical protein, partial [Nocardia nova]|uniref:hypothetical protein n=1 Tax=Nocardia nova TaxID=37330 RepID=UPI001E613FA6
MSVSDHEHPVHVGHIGKGAYNPMGAHIDLDHLPGTHMGHEQQPARGIEGGVVQTRRSAGQRHLRDPAQRQLTGVRRPRFAELEQPLIRTAAPNSTAHMRIGRINRLSLGVTV